MNRKWVIQARSVHTTYSADQTLKALIKRLTGLNEARDDINDESPRKSMLIVSHINERYSSK